MECLSAVPIPIFYFRVHQEVSIEGDPFNGKAVPSCADDVVVRAQWLQHTISPCIAETECQHIQQQILINTVHVRSLASIYLANGTNAMLIPSIRHLTLQPYSYLPLILRCSMHCATYMYGIPRSNFVHRRLTS